ncbi:hypothetical protein [Thalassovita sp.]|uniref:hypothetical protein n=1 Tax=Thalassovita sp. TaxID=1979401 RepID=UPI0029DE610E|nr:hypothetical protein [Thalassovita sp.]
MKAVAIGLALVLASGWAALAETKVGSTVENRLMAGFAVPAENLAGLLPDGWAAMAMPQGPLAGSTLLVSFMEAVQASDAEGKFAPSAVNARMALLALAVKEGEKPRLFILRVYQPEGADDAYGVAQPAMVDRAMTRTTKAGSPVMVDDVWTVSAANGDTLEFRVGYAQGAGMWLPEQVAMPFSAKDPGFRRIYRYDQLIDVVMLSAKGKMPAGGVTISAGGDTLGALLGDGVQPVAMMAIPVYRRDIFLP